MALRVVGGRAASSLPTFFGLLCLPVSDGWSSGVCIQTRSERSCANESFSRCHGTNDRARRFRGTGISNAPKVPQELGITEGEVRGGLLEFGTAGDKISKRAFSIIPSNARTFWWWLNLSYSRTRLTISSRSCPRADPQRTCRRSRFSAIHNGERMEIPRRYLPGRQFGPSGEGAQHRPA